MEFLTTCISMICIIAAGVAIYSLVKNPPNETKWKVVLVVVAIVGCIGFLGSLIWSWSDTSDTTSSWDKLSDEEKDWYHRNYGNGQYEKYQSAIDDYKKTHK